MTETGSIIRRNRSLLFHTGDKKNDNNLDTPVVTHYLNDDNLSQNVDTSDTTVSPPTPTKTVNHTSAPETQKTFRNGLSLTFLDEHLIF